MLRKSLKLHKDQSKRRNFAELLGTEMVTCVRSLCLQSENRNGSCGVFFFPPHFPDALVLLVELYRMMQATDTDVSLLCRCSLYHLKT